MTADLFISYAWTSPDHRQWVQMLAAHLKAVGYGVLIDADVDYGDSLNGFMRRAMDCRHVLLVVDENYVDRADNLPGSGVGIENWFVQAYDEKPASWLSVLFKDNAARRIPSWLSEQNPKGHSFNANAERGDFPGSDQVEELWRWVEGLPVNRDHAVSVATLRERARRLEEIDRRRDPNSWSSPGLQGEILFELNQSPTKTYSLGHGEFGFDFYVSECGADSVYVLRDHVHAVGINRAGATDRGELASQLPPGRSVVARVDDQAILLNRHGALCLVDILSVQREETAPSFVPASVLFRYRILANS